MNFTSPNSKHCIQKTATSLVGSSPNCVRSLPDVNVPVEESSPRQKSSMVPPSNNDDEDDMNYIVTNTLSSLSTTSLNDASKCNSTNESTGRMNEPIDTSATSTFSAAASTVDATTISLQQRLQNNSCLSRYTKNVSKTDAMMSLSTVRDFIFHLSVQMGKLSSQFRDMSIWNDVGITNKSEIYANVGSTIGQMIVILMKLSVGMSINLHLACMKKIQLNQRKYPVGLCKVRLNMLYLIERFVSFPFLNV
jgi:hypothetical protein